MSQHLHHEVKEGDILELSAPAGVFYLDTQSLKPVMLMSAGIGITPMIAMADHIMTKQAGREIYFFHVNRSREYIALRGDMHEIAHKYPHSHAAVFITRPNEDDKGHCCPFIHTSGRPTTAEVADFAKAAIAAGADAYICGPTSFMQDMQKALTDAGMAPEQIHSEFFGTGAAK